VPESASGAAQKTPNRLKALHSVQVEPQEKQAGTPCVAAGTMGQAEKRASCMV